MASMYFLPELGDAQLDRLSDAHVPFSEEYICLKKKKKKKSLLTTIVALGGSTSEDSEVSEPNGILIEEAHYQRTLDVLGARECARRHLGEDIHFIELEYDRIPAPVVAVYLWPESTPYQSAKYVEIIEEVLLPHVDRDIAIHFSGDGNHHQPEDDGLFHIHIFTSADAGQGLSTSRKVELFACSIPTDCHFYSVKRNENSILDADETVVGEVVNKHNVYAFYDVISLCSQGTSLFREFIEATYRLCFLDQEERLRLEDESRDKQRNRKRERYIGLCEKRVESELKAARNLLADSEHALESAWAAYQAALMRVRRQEAFVQKLEAGAPKLREKLGVEYDLFSSDLKIDRVVPGENKLSVFTKMLYLRQQNTGKIHELGRMQIDLLLGEGRNPVRIFNLSHIENGNSTRDAHPHIGSQGNLCYGNSEHQFRILLQQRELYAAAAYAIKYLETSVHSASDFRELSSSEVSQLSSEGVLPAKH